MPRRYRRRQDDPERAKDMADLVKKLRSRKKRMRKHAHEGEVANIFEGQSFSDKDVPTGPRNTGWKTIKEETTKTPSGMIIKKTTRVRRFGRMKKTAFLNGFADELEKKGFTLPELAIGLGVAGVGGVVATKAIRALLKRRGEKKKGQTKKASYLQKFAEGLRSKMVIEPTPKKSGVLEKNPFLRLESKRRLVAGKSRTRTIPKVKGLLSGSAQFAHLTQRKKEAS